MTPIDLKTWKRNEHFEFFSGMASPFFGITAEVDCTTAHKKAKRSGESFFAHYLHKSMLAVNSVEELKYRITGEEVVVCDKVHAGATIGRPDGTFGLIFVHFSRDFETFKRELESEIMAVKNSNGLRLNNEDAKIDLVRYSTIPWTSFTALLHPSRLDKSESVPKITFGKFTVRGDRKFLPVSVEAHHGLADGFHLAKYLTTFQQELDR